MPSPSKAEQEMMAIAEHHPEKLYARNRGVLKMSHQQLHDFASGPMKGKPQHVKGAKPLSRVGR
jgi:hypothetical protein